MDPLENPVWHALGERQSTLGDPANRRLARRYDPEVAPFAAMPDEATPEAWEALRELVGPGNIAVLLRDPIAIPAGWEVASEFTVPQMHAMGVPAAPDVEIATLGPDDVPAMVDLVKRAPPGPFARRTVELGTYLGVWEGGRLIAMAGERMRPRGASEISAVCTDPEHRRRGLARSLVAALVEEIRARGEQPLLHVADDNTSAIRTYEVLEFEVRRTLRVLVLIAPP